MCKFKFFFLIFVFQFITYSNSQENNENVTEVESTFEDYEYELLKMMRNIRDMIPFSSVLYVARNLNVSGDCKISLLDVALASSHLQEWSVKMFDSTGKLDGGLLEGTAMSLGDYDECQNIVSEAAPKAKIDVGSYCMVEIKPTNSILDAIKDYQVLKTRPQSPISSSSTFLKILRNVKSNPNDIAFRIGICMPSGCSVKDVQSIIDFALKGRSNFPTTVKRCEIKEEKIKLLLHQKIIIGIIGIFLIVVALSTILEMCLLLFDKLPEEEENGEPERKICKLQICLFFSLIRNTKTLMKCGLEGDSLDSIRGIKVITILMSVFVHTYALPHPLHILRFRNAFNFLKFTDQISFSGIANSSAGVETFFFIAGFLFIYLRWRHVKRLPIFTYIFKFLFLHGLRMIFAQLIVVFLFMLLPLIGSGPLFEEFVEEPLNNCKQNYWANLLFIQNFWKPYDTCLYQTWILAVMMQLFLFTALIVYIYHRWPSLGIGVSIIITIIAILIVAAVTAIAGFPPTFAVYFYDYRTALILWKYLYVQAYNHIGPFCIGMITAYLCAEHNSIKINKPMLIFGWCSSVATLLSIIYGLYDYRDGHDMHRALAVFYSAVHRPAWGIVIAWIIYACSSGYGGIVNDILSWRAFVPLERLCYFVYLVHIPVMYYHGGIQREKLFMTHFNQIMAYISYTCFSFIAAYVCYIIFQAPFLSFEKLIFGNYKGNVWQVAPSISPKKSFFKVERLGMKENNEVVFFSKSETNVSVVENTANNNEE